MPVQGTLRLAGGARGEDHQRRIVGAGLGASEWRNEGAALPRVQIIGEAGSAVATQDRSEIGKLGADLSELGDAAGVGHHRFGARSFQAIAERVRPEQHSERNGDRGELVGGEMSNNGSDTLRQEDRNQRSPRPIPRSRSACARRSDSRFSSP